MILKNVFTSVLLFLSIVGFSQNKVCESSQEDFVDLNTIGKCAIEDFKKSNKKEFVKISTRSRFVRKRSNLNSIGNLKKKLAANSSVKDTRNVSGVIDVKKKANKDVLSTSSFSSKNSVDIEKVLVRDFVKFDEVMEIPVFINCANGSLGVKQGCVKETFVNNILDNFIYPFDAAAEGIEGRVWVRFIIDKDGYVKNVTATGPVNGSLLEKEAKRLIALLPKFIPGKHNNEYVNVEYFVPIDFQLNK